MLMWVTDIGSDVWFGNRAAYQRQQMFYAQALSMPFRYAPKRI
jgi:hypothetical protein